MLLIRPNPLARIAVLALITLLITSCATSPSSAATARNAQAQLLTPITAPATPPLAPTLQSAPITYSYHVVSRYPHDSAAWTQGLVYVGDDTFYESTGQYDRSSLREVRISTGQVLRAVGLGDPMLYGEGIAAVGDTIFMITWQNCTGLLYRRADFVRYGQFSYPQPGGVCAMEGWGLTYDGSQLIMSDGTSRLSFIDPAATIASGQLAIVRQVQVTRLGTPVSMLNELEYINGAVFANIWQTNRIVQIDPATGSVIGEVDLSGLLSPAEQASADVLNGIAYDPTGDRLFVTGKLWPALFEITLEPPISYRLDLPLVIKG